MAPTQPSPRVNRNSCLNAFLRKMANSCAALIGLAVFLSSPAYGQTAVPLVTVATDQSPLNLSNQFGVPTATAVNQAGDFAFIGSGGTALFLRAAGASAATRLLQIDDELPGFPGSRTLAFFPELGIDSSRTLLFGVRFTGGDNEPHSALLTYDGTNFHTVVSSDGIAPGSGGAPYGIDLVPGSLDDSGDISFAAIPTGINATTFYIFPAGAAQAVRVAGLNDTPPAGCTWCGVASSNGSFFTGVPLAGVILGNSFVPRLNAKGQMLLSLWGGLFIGSNGGGISLVPMATTGACSPQPVATGTGLIPVIGITGFLNNNGVVAFTNQTSTGSAAICVVTPGAAQPTAAVTAADSAPASMGGTIMSPMAVGFDDSGDIVFQSPISGSNLTTFALLRYHPSNGASDVVAYNCEQAPGTNGSVFSLFASCVSWGPGIIASNVELSAFRGLSMAMDGSVSFNASLSNGGNAIYRQTGSATPELISLVFNENLTLPFGVGGGIFSSAIFSINSQTEILNNGSVHFATYVASGAADFAVYLGTPGNIQALMSTADPLPSGARIILGSAPPKAGGHFVAFTAQPAAGRTNLLESDLTSGTITRVVSDNDPALATAGGPPLNTELAPNFFLNESGQVAFEMAGADIVSGIGVIPFGGNPAVDTAWVGLPTRCGAIYLWSPSGGLKKVVAAGDAAANSSATFSCVTLNETSPSPLNEAGEVVFSSPSPYGELLPCSLCDVLVMAPSSVPTGVFLYGPTGTVSEIAAANDTLPGQSVPTTFVPSLPVPVNSSGQAAFGAELGTTTWGFYLRNGATTQKVMASGDPVPGTGDTFSYPHFISGLTDNGNLAFTAATSASTDGLFFAPVGGAIQTLALEGGAAPVPGGGTFSLAPAPSVAPRGTVTISTNSFKNFAAMNRESDVAFGASIAGGGTDSGYFRVLQSGSTAGTVQAVALQGQPTPGGGTFNTFSVQGSVLGNPGLDVGENFALGPDGTLAFVNAFTNPTGPKDGMFVARPDGTLVKVVATGDPLPGGGVLTAVSMSPKLAAGDAGKFAFLAGIAGGNAHRAIFVTAIPPAPAISTTTLSQLQSTAVAQQPVTLTATVTSAAAGTPTGTVTFLANGISVAAKMLDPSGRATFTTSSLAAGQNFIVAQYDGDSNFASGNSTPMTIIVVGFAPPPTNLSVSPGHNLVIPLTLFAPAGSTLSFTLSCSGLPANTTCMFDKNPVAPDPNGTLVQLTLTTAAGSKLPAGQPRQGTPELREVALGALLAALFGVPALFRRQTPRGRLASCACLGTFVVALAIGGCGASGYSSSNPVTPGTPAGAAAILVTATSSSTTVSAVVNVTVQ